MAVIPWILTGVGAVAGMALSIFSRRRSRVVASIALAVGLCSLLALGVLLWPHIYWWVYRNESRLTPAASLPATTVSRVLEGEAPNPHAAAWASWRPLWTSTLPHKSLSNPLVVGPLLILGTWEGTVDAFSRGTGKHLWSIKKREPVFAVTAMSENLLLAGEGVHDSVSSSLTAIRLPEGRALWQREFKGHIESAPAHSRAKSRIWLGTGPGGLWCLDSKDGRVLWHRKVGHVDSTPLLLGDLLFVLAQEDEKNPASTLFALRQDDGSEVWRIPLPGQPWGSPVFDAKRGQILVTSGIGQIGSRADTDRGWAHAVSLKGRKLNWSVPLSGNPLETSHLVSAQGLMLYTITKGEIIALKTANGAKAWSRKFESEIVADSDLDLKSRPPLLASLSLDGTFLLQDALTGAVVDQHTFETGGNSSPLFVEDGLIVTLPRSIFRYSR